MRKELIPKGYTIEVYSWENDGDNEDTNSMVVQTIEEAKLIHKICTELFCSENEKNTGVGNSMDGDGDDKVIEFYENNIELFPNLKGKNEEAIIDYFKDLAYELMGCSEWYDFRVCEFCTITYSEDSVSREEIEF